MRDVQIDKAKLLEKLKVNLEGHREVYESAMDAYQKRMIELLEDLKQRALDGKVIPQQSLYDLPMPEDHTDDYKVAIEMLEQEERPQLTLTAGEFRRYFMDQWEWRDSWMANTQSYVAQ